MLWNGRRTVKIKNIESCDHFMVETKLETKLTCLCSLVEIERCKTSWSFVQFQVPRRIP